MTIPEARRRNLRIVDHGASLLAERLPELTRPIEAPRDRAGVRP